MKKVNLLILILIFVFSTIFVIAQENEEEEIPPGMEVIEAGKVKLLVPKGSKVHKEGSMITVEGVGAYVARNLQEMEERLAEIEAREEKLKKEVEQLKSALEEIKGGLVPEQ